MDAFYTDVRADLADWRESRGLPADPMRAYAESGYQKTQDRGTKRVGSQAGWGALSSESRPSALAGSALPPASRPDPKTA